MRRLGQDFIGCQQVRVLDDHSAHQHPGMGHDQVHEGTAPEPVHIVKAHDDLRVEGQVPVHRGLEDQKLVHVGQDVAPRPRLHRTHDVELPGVHRVGYRGLPGPDHLVG